MSAEFYVVCDSSTKNCTVVDTKPTMTTTSTVDNGHLQDQDGSRDWHEDYQGLHRVTAELSSKEDRGLRLRSSFVLNRGRYRG